ncbi:MAG: type II toxin-antitoxin system prevent-host-death family antitoxin [Pseudomonadota bacterium]
MVQLNVHEAKTHLSRYLEKVERGEEFVIARDGHPVARLVPFRAPKGARLLGRGKDDFTLADDFDDPLPAKVLTGFEK